MATRSILKQGSSFSLLEGGEEDVELDLSTRKLPEMPRKSVMFREDHELVEKFVYEKVMSEEEEAAWEAEQIRLAELEKQALVARAKADFQSNVSGDLNFKEGAIIVDIMEEDGGWWSGVHDGVRGVFPSTFVKFIPKSMADKLPQMANTGPAKKVSLGGFSNDVADDDEHSDEEEETNGNGRALPALGVAAKTFSIGGLGDDIEDIDLDSPQKPSHATQRRGSLTRKGSNSLRGLRRPRSPPPKPLFEDPLEVIETHAWYHGPISRKQTEELFLQDKGKEGWFLVRKSTRAENCFVLSQCYEGKLYHNQIWCNDGKYMNKLAGTFDSLAELIEFHSVTEGGLQSALKTPCINPNAKPAKPKDAPTFVDDEDEDEDEEC